MTDTSKSRARATSDDAILKVQDILHDMCPDGCPGGCIATAQDIVEIAQAGVPQRLARYQAAILSLAAMVDHLNGQKGPYYPNALSSPELPFVDGDLDGWWFGTWEATAEAMQHDPRWTGEPLTRETAGQMLAATGETHEH